MEIEELNLEFEDDVAKPSAEAIDVDCELSFAASENTGEIDVSKTANLIQMKPNKEVAVEVKTVKVKKKPAANIAVENKAAKASSVTKSDLSEIIGEYHNSVLAQELNEVKSKVRELMEQVSGGATESEIKIAVLEAEKKYLIEAVSEAKVMDQQVTKYLQSIHKKSPAVKAEVQMIKKVITQFVKKLSKN